MPGDTEYLRSLQKLVTDNGLEPHISFLGARPHSEMPKLFAAHDMFVNLSRTGSADKAVLEAMASGLTVITINEAFVDLLPEAYSLRERSAELLSHRIQELAEEKRPNKELRELVAEHHSLKNTIRKIVEVLSSL